MVYRKELNGLRALAVISVIIYHANLNVFGFQIFKGGFFGVDVFFVLSGYLITEIIRHKMDKGVFSFRDFYWRRAKRILPALITMLLVTLGVSLLILFPDDLIIYANSLQSVLYSASNHFFYGEDSYTAAASIYRPLLHTWSLSVEWQFYIIFPFIVWVVNRFLPRYLFGILLFLALLSLQASNFIVKNNPDMAFYLLPTRSWELILGGLITFFNRSNIENITKTSFLYQSFSIIGIFLVIHSIFFIGHEAHHPSFITLIPVLGTCFFIMFSHNGGLFNYIFSLKPLVGIGLISYSLYLWHQPIFVFFRIIKHDNFSINEFLLLTIVTTIISILSYYLIENVFRKNNISIFGKLYLSLAFFICVIFSILIPNGNGFPERLGDLGTAFNKLGDKDHFKLNGQKCHNAPFDKSCSIEGTGKNILLVGDSHASALSRHLSQLAIDRDWSYKQLSTSICTQIDTLSVFSKDESGVVTKSDKCDLRSQKVSQYIEDPSTPKSTIVFVLRLPFYLSGERFNNTIGGIEKGASRWIESNEEKSPSKSISDKLSFWSKLGHEIVVVYPVPEVGWDVPKMTQKELAKYITIKQKQLAYAKYQISTPYDVYVKRAKESFEALDAVLGKNIIRVYPSDIFCDLEECIAKNERHLYYHDDDHLSTYGAKLLIEKIATLLP